MAHVQVGSLQELLEHAGDERQALLLSAFGDLRDRHMKTDNWRAIEHFVQCCFEKYQELPHPKPFTYTSMITCAFWTGVIRARPYNVHDMLHIHLAKNWGLEFSEIECEAILFALKWAHPSDRDGQETFGIADLLRQGLEATHPVTS